MHEKSFALLGQPVEGNLRLVLVVSLVVKHNSWLATIDRIVSINPLRRIYSLNRHVGERDVEVNVVKIELIDAKISE